MKCVILAAGSGSRLRQRASAKPLYPLLGVPLIERTIRSCQQAGADEFLVVTGHASDQLSAFLRQLSQRLHVPIDTVLNPDWADSENGRSLLMAEGLVSEPFMLTMADHLFDAELACKLLAEAPPEGGASLAVDGKLDNPMVDEADVTRVRRKDDRLEAIGKGLRPYDGYDTGLFFCTPAVFDALHRSTRDGDSTLSAAMRLLAAEGKVKTLPVDGCFWADVDDEAAADRAATALLERLSHKRNDGPIARWINRPLSIRISRWLTRFPVTPNQISLTSFLLSVLASALFMLGGYPALAAGGILAQFASIIDGCDGEVARLKYLTSDRGGWFDAVLDRYADAFLLFGLTWHLLLQSFSQAALATGFLAIIGSFMLSYTADKYDGLMRQLSQRSNFRMGRDLRVFLILLGALSNQVLLTLVVIALVMNLETLRRVWVSVHE